MTKNSLRSLILIGVLAALAAASHAAPGSNCPKPEWPREALRYELEGATVLRYAVGQDGKAMLASIQKSSGWKVLDNAALNNLNQCVFREPSTEGVTKPIQYAWRLDGERSLRPLLVPGSCPASEQFQTFKNLDKSPSNANGVVLRMLIGSEGKPWAVKAEAPELPSELIDAAIAFIQQCRFAIDPEVPGQRSDSTYGKLLLENKQ
ncbi:energy transducer TonB [Massilia sp. BJB1822]|uniref:energy transducer TonB n=1 Tax=Massilia sp. BJB1822 TaxID=2744470 RepID=UPI0015934A40|nr:TonB family protein [Massilia sp. BJB1822]NVD97555.1 TonB family protein [Massilia sp. BJB1822]